MAFFKRSRQPSSKTIQSLLDFDFMEESSSDSDFRIEDEDNISEASDISKEDQDDDGDSSSDDSSDDDEEDDKTDNTDATTKQLKELLEDALEPLPVHYETEERGTGVVMDDIKSMVTAISRKTEHKPKMPAKPICCVCLGDRSDDSNEIIECDGCGVTVHEGCYGVSDTGSISSTNSTCSTSPWFCEACRAGISEPNCELCPNKGGIVKETDVGRWVHLVCALYVPGVAFGEVDQLSSVTLFEMPYNKWGAKSCSLCESTRFARSGVCIGCDAGMCKTYFHVTCAQAAGFLTEAHHEDADAADPFYAHCKIHSEKEMIKKRKRNYHTFKMYMQEKEVEMMARKLEDPSPAKLRIERKLLKHQRKYALNKQMKTTPWVPTQKMSRLLTTSSSACRRLLAKADLMAIDVELMERQEAQIAALMDIRKKWHITPAFSVEFVGYYLDRISRTKELQDQLKDMIHCNNSLTTEQNSLRKDYDAQLEKNKERKAEQESLMAMISQLHKQISSLCPNKNLVNPSNIGRAQPESPPKPVATPPSRPISVPTAAALKMGVGFPLAHLGPPGSKVDSNRMLSTHAKNSPNSSAALTPPLGSVSAPTTPTLGVQTYECGICKRHNDQHLLAKCDTCKLHYHLGCLNPPLTRHPKKSKLYGWQCSECDKSDNSDTAVELLPKGPRKSRTRFNKDGIIVPVKSGESESDTGVSKQKSTTSTPVSGSPPSKRRSIDSAPSAGNTPTRQPHFTLNNKKSPKTGGCSADPMMSLANTGIPMQQESSPKIVKPAKFKTNTAPDNVSKMSQPIQVDLTSDEPVLLVLPSETVNSTHSQSIPGPDPLALPNILTNDNELQTSGACGLSVKKATDNNSKQARKQKRKEKHKNKHNLSSDTEKSAGKEHHKRKHKKRMHDSDAPTDAATSSTDGIPKIKIKFKALPLPGEETPEATFFYVSADMLRSGGEPSRPSSVETVDDMIPQQQTAQESALLTPTSNAVLEATKTTPTLGKRQPSPRKAALQNRSQGRPRSQPTTPIHQTPLNCCVCEQLGSTSNTVTCDECRKHYHFACLDPPVKKTPKIRGYSWHCADCDPTDEERK